MIVDDGENAREARYDVGVAGHTNEDQDDGSEYLCLVGGCDIAVTYGADSDDGPVARSDVPCRDRFVVDP